MGETGPEGPGATAPDPEGRRGFYWGGGTLLANVGRPRKAWLSLRILCESRLGGCHSCLLMGGFRKTGWWCCLCAFVVLVGSPL